MRIFVPNFHHTKCRMIIGLIRSIQKCIIGVKFGIGEVVIIRLCVVDEETEGLVDFAGRFTGLGSFLI